MDGDGDTPDRISLFLEELLLGTDLVTEELAKKGK